MPTILAGQGPGEASFSQNSTGITEFWGVLQLAGVWVGAGLAHLTSDHAQI